MATAQPAARPRPRPGAAGTRTSAKCTSASSSVPLACRIGRTSTPGEERSIAIMVRPRCRSSGVPVRTSARHQSRPLRPAGPDLGAVDDEVVAVAAPPGCAATRGRSRPRARRSPATRPSTRRGSDGSDGGDELARGEADQRGGDDLQVLEDRRAGPAGAEQLLGHHRAVQDGAADAARHLRPPGATPAVLAEQPPQGAGVAHAGVVVAVRGEEGGEFGGRGRHPVAEPVGEARQVRIAATGPLGLACARRPPVPCP